MDNMDYAGIEVSAKELSVGLFRNGRTRVRTFDNTPSGHRKIRRFLGMKKDRRVRVVLESTGVYGLDVAIELCDCPTIEVMVANPRAAKHFAEATLRRSKNDLVDTYVLVEFCRKMEFRPFVPPSDEAMALRALSRRIRALNKELTREKNRLHAARSTKTTPEVITMSINASIEYLDNSIAVLIVEAVRLIESSTELKEKYDLLNSVKGIAEKSAVQILGEMVCLPRDIEPRQLVAIAGLDPEEHKSGSSVNRKTKISKKGNRNLRAALYMPALTASSTSRNVIAYYQHLLEKGLTKLQAVVAVMRKLLHSILGMFKNNQPFDGDKFYRIGDIAKKSSSPA